MLQRVKMILFKGKSTRMIIIIIHTVMIEKKRNETYRSKDPNDR